MRQLRRWFLVWLIGFTIPLGVVSAVEILQDTVCTVPAGEVVRGNLYVLCRDLLVEGTVEGHIFGAVIHADITGEVTRNLYLLAGDIEISGRVGGDIHAVAGVLSILPDAQLPVSDMVSVTLSTLIESGSQLNGSVVSLGYQLVVNGDIAHNIDFWGATLNISGNIGGNVKATVGSSDNVGTASQIETLLLLLPIQASLYDPGLILTESALIDGDLDYSALSAHALDAQVGGVIRFTSLQSAPTFEDLATEENRVTAVGLYVQQVAREFTTLGLLGIITLMLLPGFVRMSIFTVRTRMLSSLGIGALCFTISFPVLLVMLVISLLILFLLSFLNLDGLLFAGGVLIGLVNIGGASLFYFGAIYVSRMVVCIALGRLIYYRYDPSNTFRAWGISLAIGTVLLALLASLPIIGLIVNAVALFIGLGALVHIVQAQLTRLREPSTEPMAARPTANFAGDVVIVSAPSPVPSTPPLLEQSTSRLQGMDNLPEGFTWWDED